MDYTGLLNEKENQIVELEKKIQNLEERLRRASKREKELEDEIVRLHTAMKGMSNANVSRQDIERMLQITTETRSAAERFEKLQSQLVAFASLSKAQFDRLRSSGVKMEFEGELSAILRAASGSYVSGISGGSVGLEASIVNGVVHLTDYRDRVVEVPVQEARTKHLIHMLAVQMKKYFEKYPKLREECDVRLYEFFQQELIDIIEVD